MSTKRQEVLNKLNTLKNHFAGLHVLAHAIEDNNIHFEIGFMDAKGHSKCVYSSQSINRTLKEYAANGYTERDGYLIDVWEGDQPAADISVSKPEGRKVMFEINKKHVTGTVPVKDDIEHQVFSYEYETVFRSISAIDCRTEWRQKGYKEPEYVMDIRESPEGKESYHVADIKESYHIANIDTKSMGDVKRERGREWLIDLLEHHSGGGFETLADRILETYGRGKA